MIRLLSRVRSEAFLFLLFLFAGSFFYYTVDYDNTSSRFFTVSAVVDFGVLHIDPYATMTADKSWGGGHAYSNKAIGAALLAVPVYWFSRKIETWRDSPPLSKGLRYGIRLATTTLPFAVLGVWLFRSARFLGASPGRSLLAACSYAFGSIAFIHAGLFSGHGIAAAFSFLSFAGLMALRRSPRRSGIGFLLGLSAGIAALADYTAMWISGILLLYAFWSPIGIRAKAGFLMGGLACALLLACYNWKCFGSPLAFSYDHQVTEAFARESQHGLLGIGMPKWKAVLALLGSPGRGLFFIMPVFLFSLEGIRRMVRTSDNRAEGIVILLVALGYVLLIGGFYGWHGGWSFGPRYFIPMLPFLALSMAFSKWERVPFVLSLGISVLQVQVVAMSLPHCPDAIQNPLPELVLPSIAEGYLAETWPGWLGLPASWSLLLYLVVCGILFLGVWISAHGDVPQDERGRPRHSVMSWGMLLWLAAMGLMAGTINTDPPQLVSLYRERLRFHRVHVQVIDRHIAELAEIYRRSQNRGQRGPNSPSADGADMGNSPMGMPERPSP